MVMPSIMRAVVRLGFVSLLFSGSLQALAKEAIHLNTPLELSWTLEQVKKNDLGLLRLASEAKVFEAQAKSYSFLPDPSVFAAIQNLPTDSFELDQEPMTQLRVGVRQMFPKGDSLNIKESISLSRAEMKRIQQETRWLTLKQRTEQAWLEAWFWQKKRTLIAEDRIFLTQMLDFIQSLYEVGAQDQSDLIGAELELIKLEEAFLDAERNFQLHRQTLNTLANENLGAGLLSDDLPDLQETHLSPPDLSFQHHPEIRYLNQQVLTDEYKVSLADQNLEPGWGVEMSYGLRDGENMDGSSRADFFSAGVTVQLPLFSKDKYRSQQVSASFKQISSEQQRDERLQNMRFELDNLHQQLKTTARQRALYESKILPTLESQKQSALQSYEADKGNFNLVSQLYLKEQQAETKYQRLRVNEQKLISKLNYLVGESDL